MKEYLSNKRITYHNSDISVDIENLREMIRKTRHLGIPVQQLGVPIITVDDEVVLGFNKAQLDKIFKT